MFGKKSGFGSSASVRRRLLPSVRRGLYGAAARLSAVGLVFMGIPLEARGATWTAASGGDTQWSNPANWDLGEPTAASDILLPDVIPNPGALADPATILLSAGELANSITFSNSYTLSGGSLELTSGLARVSLGASATIDSQLTGTAGLWKRGDGALRLGNPTNSYLGTTQIDAGVVSILSAGALGADTSAVVVTGNILRGSGGGQLVVGGANNNLAGTTFTRALALTGGAITADNGALLNVGDNLYTGAVTFGDNPAGLSPVGGVPVTATGSYLGSAFGTATFTGPMTLGPSSQTISFTGAGNFIVSGDIGGPGNLTKLGSGSLELRGVNDFGGIVAVNGGFLRVASGLALGTSTSTSALSMQSGTLEIRTDTFDFNSRRVRLDNGGTIFVDHAVGSNLLNQTVTFNLLTIDATETLVLNGRNGYGVTFVGNMAALSHAGDSVFTLNGNGLTTIQGNFWNNTNGTARTFTVNGNGDSLITGSVLASGGNHILTKRGTGTMTILGTASTIGGQINIEGGTLAITDFRSLTNNGAVIKIGANGTGLAAGTLEIIGNNLLATNLTTDKVVSLGGTTNGATILANQTGASAGIVFNANFTTSANGYKSLTLGGSNTQDNTINGSIVDSGAGSTWVKKVGDGTWALSGANGYSGSTQIAGGTLKLRDVVPAGSRNILSDFAAVGFVADGGAAGGVLQYIGVDGAASGEQLGPLALGAGSGNVVVTSGLGGTAILGFQSIGTTQTAAAGSTTTTVTVGSTAGLVPGMVMTGGSPAVTIVSITNDTQFVVSADTTVTSGATLSFGRPNGTTLNFAPDSGGSIFIGALPTAGFIGGYTYFRGADFAYAPAALNAQLRAPQYDVDAGFVTAAGALVDGSHNRVSSSVSSGAVTIGSLKIVGSLGGTAVEQTGLLTINAGAGTPGGILATGGAASIGGTGITTGGAGDLIIRVDAAGDTLTLNAPITSTTTGGLTKSGAGTLVISALNAQTGGTNINEGTVMLTPLGRLAANNTAFVLRQGATLDLNGTSMLVGTASAIGSFNGAGRITNGSSSPAVLAIGSGTTGGTGTFSGVIGDGVGKVSVIKLGTTNSMTWSGLNTYTGSTTINGTGKITIMYLADIGQASGLGRGDATDDASNAASLVFTGSSSTSPGGIIYAGANSASTNRLFTIDGGANTGVTLNSSGINNATIVFRNPAPIAYGASAVGTKVLNLDGTSTGDNRIDLRLIDNTNDGGALSVVKNNTGLWVLGGLNNTYSGITSLVRGTLRAIDGSSLSPNSPLLFNATSTNYAVFESSGLFTRSLGTGPGQVSWAAAANGGFAAYDSKLTVNIGGNGDLLTWGVGGFVTTNLVLNSTTALAEVEIVNAINLGGTQRTIQVDANSTTGGAFATISGAISGSAGIVKTGGGILQLVGLNTYSGNTNINGGTVRATIFGNSASTSSSFGDGSGTVTIGTGSTSGVLTYVGAGENSNRLIQLAGTTASTVIEANGSGAIRLSNVVNAATGTSGKTLTLRGFSNDANEIGSVLADNPAGGVLTVSKSEAGTWILSGQNTYTGTTTISQGALGIGANSTPLAGAVVSGPVGLGRLIISNSSIFAAGADRTIANDATFAPATSTNVIGAYSLTLNGNVGITGTTSSTSTVVTNSLPAGKFFTINSPIFTHVDAAARSVIFNGSGDTILNSSLTDSTNATSAPLNFTYNGYGSLTLGGSNGASTFSGTMTLGGGTLRIGVDEALPSGVGKSELLVNPAAGVTAALDLNGHTQTLNGLNATTAGLFTIDNSSAAPGHLILGANNGASDGAVNVIGGISNTGSGALSITKIGSGAAVFSQGPFNHAGATIVTGGTLTFAANVGATNALSVTGAGSLLLSGGLTSTAITSVTVGGGSLLSLIDGAGSQLLNLSTLNLGGVGAGAVTLNLNVGDLAVAGDGLQTDTLRLLGGGLLSLGAGNSLLFNLNDAGLNPGTTYTLLNALDGGFLSGPLGIGNYALGSTPGGFTSITLNVTDNLVQITTGALVTGNLYWTGAIDDAWNGGVGNWSTTKDGLTAPASIPGAGTNAVFQSDVLTGGAAIVTALEQSITINSLRFEPSTVPANTPASVTIDPGVDSAFRLQIRPQVATDGIAMLIDGTPSVVINSPLRLGAAQTWSIAAAGQTLTVNGALSGDGALTKSGAGKVVVAAAADPTYAVPSVTVAGGTLQVDNLTALGNAAVGNASLVTVAAGSLFYYNSATSGTFANNLVLSGGTLAAGGNNQTYSGTINFAADSTISTRDMGVTAATARTITLAGVLSGPGGLTLNGNPALSAGNSVTGTLVITQANPLWTGDVLIQEGAIDLRTEQSLGTGALSIETGRVLFKGLAGQTWNMLAAGLTIDDTAGNAVGEFHADNQQTTGQFTANIAGDIVLGGGGAAPILRLYQSDLLSNLTITGNILLNADAIIHNSGSSSFTLQGQDNVVFGVISDGGAGRNLTINGDATWGSNNYQVLRLDGANTFGGFVRVGGGVLAFSTVSNNGGGPSNLGQGTDGLILAGGTLRFVGGVDQATNRAISFATSTGTLDASGGNGATITYNGPIDAATTAASLTLVGTGSGVINGPITQSGTSVDILVNSGNWTLAGAANTFADDIIVAGPTAVLNLATPSMLNYVASTSNGLYARSGGVINILADDVSGPLAAGGLDYVIMDTGVGTLNLNGFTFAIPRLDLGGIIDSAVGNITAGTLVSNFAGTDYSQGFRFFEGQVDADLVGTSSMLKQGLGDVVLTGDNSGLTGTVATRVDSGALVLDFTTDNNLKLNDGAALDLRGGTVRLLGNGAADSTQSVTSTTLGGGGSSRLELVSNGTFVYLNLGAVSRANAATDGTLRIVQPTFGAVKTTTANGTYGVLGAAGYATVQDSTGTYFAVNDGAGNIAGLTYAGASNDIALWNRLDHVTDDTTGYTGTLNYQAVNSLRFNAPSASTITVGEIGVLGVMSGGILVTSAATGATQITGGVFAAATNEIILTHDGAQPLTIASDLRSATFLTKSGGGTLILTGQSTSTGTIDLQDGTIIASGGNAIGDAGIVNFADDHAVALLLNDDETVGRLSGGSATAGLDHLAVVDLNGHVLTLNQTAAASFSGRFAGLGTIVKQGPLDATYGNNSLNFLGDVVVNSGGFVLSNLGATAASTFTVNNGGMLWLSSTSSTRSTNKILDTTSVTLNSAAGGQAGGIVPRGLYISTNQNAGNGETIGVLTFNSGANYLSAEASGGTSAVAAYVADDFVRNNNATVTARGINLGGSSGARTQFRIGTAANQTAWLAAAGNLVGGGGTVGGSAKNVSIVPWAIGENLTAAATVTNMGNTLVTYVSGRGFVPLNLTNEFNTFAAKASNADNIRESLTTDLTGLAGQTINALVLHNNNTADSSVAVTGSGTLTNTSGAFLFTLNTAAADSSNHTLVLNGFADIGVGATNEYVFTVVNPSADATTAALTAAINSTLSSIADITKSGRGALVLTGVNTAGGGTRKTVLNEGILEIADLDNIGGLSGDLIFAGGTLRLATAYSGDELTSRNIQFLIGGGTLDTNGVDLAIAGSLGTGVGGFTKAGLGRLTLAVAPGYTGTTTVDGGVLAVGDSFSFAGELTVGTSGTFDVGTFSASFARVTLQGAAAAVAGTGTVSAAAGFAVESGATIDAVLAGAGGLLKTGSTVLTLKGLNTYAGYTEIQAGTVVFNSIADVGAGSSALGAPTTAEAGLIRLGLGTATAALTYTGSGHTSNRVIALEGSTGGVAINADGTGALVLGGVQGEFFGAKTLTLAGTSDASLENGLGAIVDPLGTVSILKAGVSTWNFNAANTYLGSTTINQGTLRSNVDQNMAGALQFGSADTVTTGGLLDLSGVSAQFGSLLVQINSTVDVARVQIGVGETLQINGNVTIGGNGTNSTTLFSAGGGGEFRVENANTNGLFGVGGNDGAGNITVADFTGLTNVSLMLDAATGTVRVNPVNSTAVAGKTATLLLPTTGSATFSVRANAFNIGDSGQNSGAAGQVNAVVLAAGANTMHVNAINIGTGSRDLGSITIAGAGTLVVRAADGVGAADLNMGTGSATTAGSGASGNTFDVRGHNADLLFDAVAMGTQNRNATLNNYFGFDQGTLAIASLTMSTKGANGNTTTSIMELGGGTVTIGSGSGAAATLATSTGAGVANAEIKITGGSVTLLGDIVKGNQTGTGATEGKVTLAGASALLDMSNFSIGSATNTINFTAQAGTLRNLAEFNGGAALVKSGGLADSLTLDTANAYTGATQITGGVLRAAHSSALGSSVAGTTVADFTALELAGAINIAAEALSLSGDGVLTGGALRSVSGNNIYGGAITLAAPAKIAADADTLTLSGGVAGAGQAVTFGGAGRIIVQSAGITTGSGGSLTKTGSGSLSLNSAVNYTGPTTVAGGTLNGSASLASTQLVVQGGGTFSPGYSPNGVDNNGVGQTSVAAADWQDGASFVFDFGAVDFGNTTSGITDWDFISILGGGLNLSGSNYTVRVFSWDLGTGLYGTNDFNPNAATTLDNTETSPGDIDASYRWLWVENAGLADGYLSQFNVVAEPGVFGSGPYGLSPGGTFWVSAAGSNLYINYSSVPEPGSLMLVGLAGLGWFGYRRRRKHAETKLPS